MSFLNPFRHRDAVTFAPNPLRHSAEFLDEVRRPGPNGQVFHHLDARAVALSTGSNIMEDDTEPSLFTPGCEAYAGYANGSFANMTAVRAYAASQGARSFSYTPDGYPGADAIDMEPGDASPGDFPGFYRAKGGKNVYGYGSASWVSQVIGAASAAGIARSSYKLVSAHYIGPHICGPGSCGYPQADATQFTDTYLGRSLDATLCSAGFFTTGPVPPPNPYPVLSVGSSGSDVVTLQQLLNKHGAKPPLATDGAFGPLTQAALIAFQQASGLPAGGVTDKETWLALRATTPPPPSVKGVTVSETVNMVVEWQSQAGATTYTVNVKTPDGKVNATWTTTAVKFTVPDPLPKGWTYHVSVSSDVKGDVATVVAYTT